MRARGPRRGSAAVVAGLVAVALCLSLGAARPAGAAAAMTCASDNGTVTFSPPLPAHGDPATVRPTVTATGSIGGCVGLGLTGGTEAFSGMTDKAESCDNDFGNGGDGIAIFGTLTITWNNGQTSTFGDSTFFPTGSVTSGLFLGGTMSFVSGTGSLNVLSPACDTPLGTTTYTQPSLTLTLPDGTAACDSPQACDQDRAVSASAQAPGMSVNVTGTPAVGIGTVSLSIASRTLTCPKVAPSVRPAATLTDTGFAPTDKLNVTATLPLASSTSSEQVCFRSTVPFKSQSNPTVKKAGTALLLNCTQVANVPPCVKSTKQVGSNVVVTFVVPGGDPTFIIVPPTGREMWALTLGRGTVGTTYSAHFTTKGGRAPFSWRVASGRLPPGCTLNPASGTVSGKPTTKGTYTAVIQSTDSEKPRKKARLSVPFTIG
jgi:hypothetical protein